MSTEKNPAKKTRKPKGYVFGRPTKYHVKYCQDLIEKLSAGMSVTRFAASINVSKDTVYEWVKVHPDFSDAFKLARTKCEATWEVKFLDYMVDSKVNSPLIKLYYANMFKWSDKTEEVVTHNFDESLANLAKRLPD